MYSNTSQAFYTKSLHQETQQQPLRSRAFSHLDNVPHQPTHHQSYSAHLSEDKVSEIKKKYDKSYTPNNAKPPKETIPQSGSNLSFGKTTMRYEAHDENNTWSPYKEPTHHQRSLTDQIGSNSHYGVPKMSYGRPSAKSELQSGLSALNSMKNELKCKLNDLASKNQVNASQFLKEHQFKEMRESNLNTSYDLIVSKYSRTNGLPENETPQNNFSSNYHPEYVADKKMPHLETLSGSGFPYNYSFANKSTILERQAYKVDLLPMNEPKSTQYNFSKQNRVQRQSEDLYKKNTEKAGPLMIPERNERRTILDSKVPDQKTTPSYMNAQKDGTRQQQRNNFEFTLRKNEEVDKSYIKPTDNSFHNQSLKFEARTDNYSKYDIKNTKPNNTIKKQQPAKIPHSPYKGETRDSTVISRQIQKLDLKIKQIEQNKKALNINFSPYSQSKSTNKISATPKQNPKHQLSTYERQETRSVSPMLTNPPKSSIDIERKRPIIEPRYQDLLKTNATINQSMPFQSIRNGQRPIFIPFTPAESHNEDDQQTSERSNADMSFESKKLTFNNKNADDYGMQDRKKQTQSSNTIKGLVKALGEQVALDEAFRNNKIWFASENSERKWALLKKELQNIGVNINESMLKDTFSLEESQNNPFFSVSDSKCNIQSLAQSYLQGQSHWDQKVNRKFRRTDLDKEGLNSQKIDYDRKGFIEVEDLVRFLNLQSGTFFRLRDVSLIFKRITKNSKMQFGELLDAVSA